MSRLFAILVLAATLANSQTPAGRITGTVTGADPATRQLSVQIDKGDVYAVSILDAAKLMKIAPGVTDMTKAEPIAIDAIAKGDKVLARGTQDVNAKTMLALQIIVISKSELQSRDAARTQEWKANSIGGIVKSINPITVQSRGNLVWTVEAAKAKTVHRYADDSSNFTNAKLSTAAEIQPGDQIRVLGAKDADAKKVDASEIVYGRFATIGGEIKSINVATNSITLYDLTTKKNVTFQVVKEARITKLPSFPGGPQGAGPRGMSPNGPPGGMPARAGNTAGGPPAGAGGPPAGMGRPPAGAGGPPAGAGAPGGGRPGGFGGGGGMPDPAMMMERMPPAQFSDLKAGDAVILTAGKTNTPNPVALSLVAGLDFLLRAPAQQASQMIANWNVEGGGGLQ